MRRSMRVFIGALLSRLHLPTGLFCRPKLHRSPTSIADLRQSPNGCPFGCTGPNAQQVWMLFTAAR